MKRTTITTIGCALALAAGTARAQQADPPMAPPAEQGGEHHHGGGQRGFDAIDTNHDGFITLDEWKAAGRREDRFAMIDADHDGRITRDEMRAAMARMRAMREHNGGGEPGGEHPDGH
ncbi:EF-hand domain-containing protein [Novosphingobium acidiphilum]|uniref:EF-hand domain-containing protein n=1 Tax=Novosphingobium acidiphilum TaxID=505248 RepID=UPI00040483AC|nr:EF-hand domain-containing protein [Novosphingobium acidiphilum]